MSEDFRIILKSKGFVLQPDGSYSKALAQGLPNSLTQRPPRTTLVQTPPGKDQGFSGVKVSISRFARRLLDADNFAGGCKAIIDQLRYEKCIKNDDPGSITLEFHQKKVSKKEEEGTLIEIYE